MKNNLQKIMMEQLAAVGLDVNKFNINLEIKLEEKSNLANQLVEDKQIEVQEISRRWITAQTFKMLYTSSYNEISKTEERGWDAYLRNNYPYMYQFKMLLEEIKVIAKLEKKDKDAFKERIKFFNKDVVIETCSDYMEKLNRYVAINSNDNKIHLPKYGTITTEEYSTKINAILSTYINQMMEKDNTYYELYILLRMFYKKMCKLPKSTPKCKLWRDAFKGSGAYYSLKNMILYHNVLLKDKNDKYDSLDYLEKYTSTLSNGELWRLHYLLKETIELNNFNLKESISKQR